MKFQISMNGEIDFVPANEVAEILQNVRTILTTCVGTVPLHRDFGISWEHVDKPLPVAQSLMQAAVIDAIEEFEPRARVESVNFEENTDDAMDGILRPIVIVSIGTDDEQEEE